MMILEKSDLENDRTLDEQLPSLEPATILLENDLFDAYINSNGYVVDWIDDQIQDDPCQLLKALRDNWTRDGVAMRTVYMKYIGKVCQRLAESMDSLEEIEKLYKDADLYGPEVTGVQ